MGTHAVSSFLSLCSQGTTLILWVPLIVMSVVEFVVSGRCCAVSVSFIRRRTRIHCETRPVCNTMVHVITRTAYTSLMSLYSSIASLHTSCLSVTIYTDNFVKTPPLELPITSWFYKWLSNFWVRAFGLTKDVPCCIFWAIKYNDFIYFNAFVLRLKYQTGFPINVLYEPIIVGLVNWFDYRNVGFQVEIIVAIRI